VLELEQYLEGLVHRVCADLANIYPGVGPASTHGLIFPTKRDGSLRISEQEAKLLFFQHLTLDRKFFFSVETPTVETYRQKGMTPMSARVDLTLYDSDRKPVAHVEYKSHNCGLEDIRKDLEKLLREKRTGCWFHTLENANRNTIPVRGVEYPMIDLGHAGRAGRKRTITSFIIHDPNAPEYHLENA
jgi:hypothetical protein